MMLVSILNFKKIACFLLKSLRFIVIMFVLEVKLKFKEFAHKFFHDKAFRTSKITHVTMYYNYIWACAKIVFGIFFNTLYFCLSGIYTILIAFTKRVFHNNFGQVGTRESLKKFLKMAILILVASAIFVMYMSRLFFMEYTYTYSTIMGVAIATFSFTELGIAIGGLVSATKKNDYLMTGIKCCNLSSALIAIVLTQIALLSLPETINASFYNAITGVVLGGLSMLIGVFMIIYYKRTIKTLPEEEIQS